MSRPLLLDLFCGAGGASVGYERAGFQVLGVDLNPMPRYPFRFVQADALEFLDWLIAHPSNVFGGVSAIHGSPPCQHWSAMTNCKPGTRDNYPELIDPLRERLEGCGRPWVIENVIGAPLRNPVMLCGTSFGKQIRRHRLFETSFPVEPLPCKHEGYVLNPHNADGRKRIREQFGPEANVEGVWRKELGVGWMSGHEARESIPPTYTDYIGQYLMGYLKGR